MLDDSCDFDDVSTCQRVSMFVCLFCHWDNLLLCAGCELHNVFTLLNRVSSCLLWSSLFLLPALPRLANLTGNIHRHQPRSSCDCFWHPQSANILTREVLYFRNCALSSDYADLSPRIRGCCVLEVLPRLILRRSQPCNRNTTSTKIIPSHASSQQQSGILQFFVWYNVYVCLLNFE